MDYSINEIQRILTGKQAAFSEHTTIEYLVVDSRKIQYPTTTLFFALPGNLKNGEAYVKSAYQNGVRNFVVSSSFNALMYQDANFIFVDNTLRALQKIATHHRSQYPNLRRIGITGSNGKTIIKEWLYQMLFDKFAIVKSPKSYNSQIGMPLSIAKINAHHTLGIFEAGISEKNEMVNHLAMLSPQVGILTNIGSAHDAGFSDKAEKLEEKLILFRDSETIIYCGDHEKIAHKIKSVYPEKELFSWGSSEENQLQFLHSTIKEGKKIITYKYKGQTFEISLAYTDIASEENISHCIAFMLWQGVEPKDIQSLVHRVSGIGMRLELTNGVRNNTIINDAYSADLDALEVALDFMGQHAGNGQKVVVLSALEQSGMNEKEAFSKILEMCSIHRINTLYYLGNEDSGLALPPDMDGGIFYTKEEITKAIENDTLSNAYILVKGARKHQLEEIATLLANQMHSASLTINLAALENNIRVYKSYLKPKTKIMAVVKASAYGSGAEEVAKVLVHNQIDYLAVAFTDEGIQLRQAGIDIPILILNPDIDSIPEILKYNLEIEIYAHEQVRVITKYADNHKVDIPIHLKIDTGMHRLGFSPDDIDFLTEMANHPRIKIKSIFSHLASSEADIHDDYTNLQFEKFNAFCDNLIKNIEDKPLLHILNSGGITRFPQQQNDMVRLGIGIYGIDINPAVQPALQKVHGLYASIIQIKNLKKGASVGYGRRKIVDRDTRIGIVNIGYADGVMRSLSNGKYALKIGQETATILGSVCMDLIIIDLTDTENVHVGDTVTIFDQSWPIEDMAKAADTIPYEILARISTRVKRRFYNA